MSTSMKCLPIFRIAAACALLTCARIAPALAESQNPGHGEEIFAIVMGVTTPFGTFGLLKHLEGIPGVEKVTFSLRRGLADIIVKPGAFVSDEQIRQAILSASYSPGDIIRPDGSNAMHGTADDEPDGSEPLSPISARY